MSEKKDFDKALAVAVGTLTGDPNYLTSEEKENLKTEKEEKPVKKILLKMDQDLHAALQKEARKIAAEEDRNYSLTELINDILKRHLKDF